MELVSVVSTLAPTIPNNLVTRVILTQLIAPTSEKPHTIHVVVWLSSDTQMLEKNTIPSLLWEPK